MATDPAHPRPHHRCRPGDQTPTPGPTPAGSLSQFTGDRQPPPRSARLTGRRLSSREHPHGRPDLSAIRRPLPAVLGATRPGDQARCRRAAARGPAPAPPAAAALPRPGDGRGRVPAVLLGLVAYATLGNGSSGTGAPTFNAPRGPPPRPPPPPRPRRHRAPAIGRAPPAPPADAARRRHTAHHPARVVGHRQRRSVGVHHRPGRRRGRRQHHAWATRAAPPPGPA